MASMEKKILDHFLKHDPILCSVLHRFIDHSNDLKPIVSPDYFSSLCETIINQQLSEKAGNTIHLRFLQLFHNTKPTPDAVNKLSTQQLRGVGMSGSKVRFIQSLGESFSKKQIDFEILSQRSDDSVITELMKLHGIGRWSAEMFLIFSLGREDVFSFGDAGLRKALNNEYGNGKVLKDSEIRGIVEMWSPYKSYACRILWKSLDTLPL